MTQPAHIPLPAAIEDEVRAAYAAVGCHAGLVRHEVADGLGVGGVHTLRIDMTAWGRSLHQIERTEMAMLSLHHLLRHQDVPLSRKPPEIADLADDDLMDLVMASIEHDVAAQRRLRDVAAGHGIARPIPIEDDGDVGPITIDRFVARNIVSRPGGLASLRRLVLTAASSPTPVRSVADPDDAAVPFSVHRYAIVCEDVPRLLATMHLASDECGEPTIEYDGFTLTVSAVHGWPETLILGLPGHRVVEIVATGIPEIDDRTIDAVGTDPAGACLLHLRASAVPVRDVIRARS